MDPDLIYGPGWEADLVKALEEEDRAMAQRLRSRPQAGAAITVTVLPGGCQLYRFPQGLRRRRARR